MVRGYLPDNIWRVLAELSNFFCQLCANELSRAVILDMEKVAPVLLCKLEKIFPPAFFNPMQGRASEDDIPPSDSAGYVDIADSDDEDYDPANPDYDDYF